MSSVSEARGGVLVVGSTGLIGRALMHELQAGFEPIWGTTRGTAKARQLLLDLAAPAFANQLTVPAFSEAVSAVRCAFLCGAISRFEDCAADPGLSFRVNVTNILTLAKFLLDRGVAVIYLSSNAVFDGAQAACDESVHPHPVTEYGRQKAAAEAGLQELVATLNPRERNVKIARLTKVLSMEIPLIGSWIRSLRAGQSIVAFSDLIFAPVSLRYAIAALINIATIGKSGIYHLSGSTDVSYYDFARALAQSLGVDPGLVGASCAAARSDIAVLPRYSALGMTANTHAMGMAFQGLHEVIKDLTEEAANEN